MNMLFLFYSFIWKVRVIKKKIIINGGFLLFKRHFEFYAFLKLVEQSSYLDL